MASAEERINILKMVQEGTLSADEGLRRLEQPNAAAEPAAPAGFPSPAPLAHPAPSTRGDLSRRYLRINVSDARTGNRKVFVRVPVSLVKMGLRMGSNYADELRDLDLDAIEDWLANGQTGPIVEVQDEEDGEHVEIYIE